MSSKFRRRLPASALITAIITSSVFVALLFVLFIFSDLVQRQVRREVTNSQAVSLGNGGLNRAIARYRADTNYSGEPYDLTTGGVDTYIEALASDPTIQIVTARVYVPKRTGINRTCKVFKVQIQTPSNQVIAKTYEEYDEPDCGASITPKPATPTPTVAPSTTPSPPPLPTPPPPPPPGSPTPSPIATPTPAPSPGIQCNPNYQTTALPLSGTTQVVTDQDPIELNYGVNLSIIPPKARIEKIQAYYAMQWGPSGDSNYILRDHIKAARGRSDTTSSTDLVTRWNSVTYDSLNEPTGDQPNSAFPVKAEIDLSNPAREMRTFRVEAVYICMQRIDAIRFKMSLSGVGPNDEIVAWSGPFLYWYDDPKSANQYSDDGPSYHYPYYGPKTDMFFDWYPRSSALTKIETGNYCAQFEYDVFPGFDYLVQPPWMRAYSTGRGDVYGEEAPTFGHIASQGYHEITESGHYSRVTYPNGQPWPHQCVQQAG